jgi:hypothetical protein
MPVPKVDADFKSRFNFILCIDLIVFACILVIAGRPDGLAITVSAVIVCGFALIYRCALGIKSYAAKSSARTKATRHSASQPVRRPPVTPVAVAARSTGKSWLRDSD